MPAMHAAADLLPNFMDRPRIVADDLRRVQDPCVVLEADWLDSDGERCYAFTVGGWLDGRPLGDPRGGCTIGGDVIVVHARDQAEAKVIASMGLQDTLDGLNSEEQSYIEANAALARLQSVGPVRRTELATAAPADKSDEFEADAALIRPLRGDDILLTSRGGGPDPAADT
jgi:hypothetical protein